MKKSMKFVAAFVLMCLSLSTVTPKVAEAGTYNTRPGIFATDSYISPDGSWCEAVSENLDCLNDVTQHVQVFSVIYYKNKETGTRGLKPLERYEEADGNEACAKIYCPTPTYVHEIYLITSIHNGYYMKQRITENTRASR